MNIQINDELIPGTKLLRDDMGGITGMEFLKKIFFISDGVMLTQIREISGIEGSTLQNWTKRGWVANSVSKKYGINQLANILIINMLRSCIQLDRIAMLISYINGDINDASDDIIEYSLLYDYICRSLDELMKYDACSFGSIKDAINKVTADYEERLPGAKQRLVTALEIIVIAYYSALIKKHSDSMLDRVIPLSRKGV